jgi:hypothetical protein
VEAAGGVISTSGGGGGGRLRVNGELAVTRAVGDVSLKPAGVIPNPTVSSRITLSSGDSNDDGSGGGGVAGLVLVSDGAFDVLTADEICSLAFGGGGGGEEGGGGGREGGGGGGGGGGEGVADGVERVEWGVSEFDAWRGGRLGTGAGGGAAVIALGGEPPDDATPKQPISAGGGSGADAWKTPTETGALAWLRAGTAAATRAAISIGSGDNVAVLALLVGRCRLTVSKPVSKPSMVSALETII